MAHREDCTASCTAPISAHPPAHLAPSVCTVPNFKTHRRVGHLEREDASCAGEQGHGRSLCGLPKIVPVVVLSAHAAPAVDAEAGEQNPRPPSILVAVGPDFARRPKVLRGKKEHAC